MTSRLLDLCRLGPCLAVVAVIVLLCGSSVLAPAQGDPLPKIGYLGFGAATPPTFADRREEDAYFTSQTFRQLVDTSGIRASLSVALRRGEALLGMINVYRQEVRPFTDKQISLVQNFAAQAVIAIENTRLLNELRESLEQQTAASEVLSVISSSPGDLEPVFQAMLANATRICEAKFGTLNLYDGSVFEIAAHPQRAARLCGNRNAQGDTAASEFGPR